MLSLAAEFGRPIDLHTDETLDPAVLHLSQLADLVAEAGFPHGVPASHCVSLGVQPPEVAAQVAARVAATRVAVVCNPQTSLFLQGRGQRSTPVPGLTALRALLDAGATVAGGGDNLRDPFNVVGRADPLETASLLVTAGHLTPEEAYAAVSVGARAAMGLAEVRVESGFPAELLAVRASSLGEAIAGGTSRVVIHHGRVVSRTTVTRDYPDMNGNVLASHPPTARLGHVASTSLSPQVGKERHEQETCAAGCCARGGSGRLSVQRCRARRPRHNGSNR